jgi:ribosomal protein L40E
MNVCKACGHKNVDDAEFCEACQDYLWKDRRVALEEKRAARRVRTIETTGATIAQPSAPEHGAGSNGTSQADGLQAIPPDMEFAARKPEPPPFRAPEPGDLICDQCRTGNRASAKFCRRCGSSLAYARAARGPSWLQRLLARRRRTYVAGERRRRQSVVPERTTVHKARRSVFHASRALAVVSLLGLVSVGALRARTYDHAANAYRDARLWLFPRYEPAIPTTFNATSSLRRHGPARAFDKNRSSFWAEGAPGDGRGQKLVAHFDHEVSLARVGFTLGDQSKPQNFVKQPVPRVVRVRLFDPLGNRIATKFLSLEQTPDFQRFSLEGNGVTKVVVTILRVYHSPTGHAAAISEVELFEKK